MPEEDCPRAASSAEGAPECCRNDIRQDSPCFRVSEVRIRVSTVGVARGSILIGEGAEPEIRPRDDELPSDAA
jgi:hypothetical protein